MDSTKRTARIAGLAYLVMGLTGAFSLMYVPSTLVVRGDATATAAKIAASELLVRIDIVSGLVSGVGFILLALLLYQLLKPVDARQAALMVIMVLVSVPISFVNTLNKVAALVLVSDAGFLSAFTKPQLDALAMFFLRLWSHGNFVAEIFWGLWLFPFGLLVVKSRFLPRVLGVLLLIGAFAYVTHSVVSLLLPGPQNIIYRFATITAEAAAELPISLWLLIKGVARISNHSLGGPPGRRT